MNILNFIHVLFRIFSIVLLVSTTGNTQSTEPVKSNGIFLTREEFMTNTPSITTDAENGLTLSLDKVTILNAGQKQTFRFGSIYGYIQNGDRYRAYGNKSALLDTYGYYKILDDARLVAYSKWSHSNKTGGHLWYYYAIIPDGEIKRLTKVNIKRDFAAYPDFVNAVNEALKNENILEDVHGRSRLNHLYNQLVVKTP